MESESNALQCHQSSLHLLPCSIEHDGPTQVTSFFQVVEGEKENVAYFRGRELKGIKIAVPVGVQGLCVGDCGEGKWLVEGSFSETNFWEHDSRPDKSQIDEVNCWFDVAKSVSIPKKLS
jgi:hypothetical protein